MCRMIAAVGRFEMEPLVDAVRVMASNANPAYDHELRPEGGALVHDCGWGVAFREGGRLVRRRSAASCLNDPEFDSLSGVETDLVILHARRTPDRDTINVLNSHPFLQEWSGEEWAFCHNGAVSDLTQLRSDESLVPTGGIDSELLFHHVLALLDTSRVAESLSEILREIRDFTCLNCFLATSEHITVQTRVSPGTSRPLYYTLWIARGGDVTVVSSEVVSLGALEWERVTDGSAFVLSR
ncbi:class II glutamine amidotransferase [bacterium]|nr:class II glutamine amidotransferase [bacterium]